MIVGFVKAATFTHWCAIILETMQWIWYPKTRVPGWLRGENCILLCSVSWHY